MRMTMIWIISVILLQGCDQARKKIVESHRPNFIGDYKIDLSKSKIGGYENKLNLYKNLTLCLDSDGKFDFNMSVPFIYKLSGKWEMGGDGESIYAILKYSDSLIDQAPMDTTGAIFIRLPIPKDNQKQIGLLYLDRVGKSCVPSSSAMSGKGQKRLLLMLQDR